jgi:hypothetical protein
MPEPTNMILQHQITSSTLGRWLIRWWCCVVARNWFHSDVVWLPLTDSTVTLHSCPPTHTYESPCLLYIRLCGVFTKFTCTVIHTLQVCLVSWCSLAYSLTTWLPCPYPKFSILLLANVPTLAPKQHQLIHNYIADIEDLRKWACSECPGGAWKGWYFWLHVPNSHQNSEWAWNLVIHSGVGGLTWPHTWHIFPIDRLRVRSGKDIPVTGRGGR